MERSHLYQIGFSNLFLLDLHEQYQCPDEKNNLYFMLSA